MRLALQCRCSCPAPGRAVDVRGVAEKKSPIDPEMFGDAVVHAVRREPVDIHDADPEQRFEVRADILETEVRMRLSD
jgi:hypothetical protein